MQELELNEVVTVHEAVLKSTGGASGIRDMETLKSALARPFQTWGGDDLYPSILSKTAALLESLVANHPFVDGNKRTGIMAALGFLDVNNLRCTASSDQLFKLVIDVASGTCDQSQIERWLSENTTFAESV